MTHPAVLGAAAQQASGAAEATIIETLGATYWLSTVDFDDDTIQALPPRIGATPSTRGSNPAAVDSADPAINLTGTPRLVFAGDDYVQFPAEAIPTFTHTTGQSTLVIVAATVAGATAVLWQTNASIDAGFSLFVRNATDQIVARVGSSTRDSVATVNFNDGAIRGIGMVISGGTFQVYERSIGFGTVQTALAPTHTMARLGGAASPFWSGVVYHVACFPTALTESDLEDAIDYLIGLT